VGELVAEFQYLEERWLEQPGMRICNLLLGPPPSRARLADRLDNAIGQRGVELAARREADVELEAQLTSATWVWDLVLDNAIRSSSLAASLSMAVELLEGRVDATAFNRVG
jgi:hypothetical protein